jgi:hypothetical protein
LRDLDEEAELSRPVSDPRASAHPVSASRRQGIEVTREHLRLRFENVDVCHSEVVSRHRAQLPDADVGNSQDRSVVHNHLAA